MIIAALFFYLFAGMCIASAVMVIASNNPVHSVLFLILAFVNAAGLFVLMGAEFLAMILVIVYVGAVAVLFLFVVMMLDVDFTELRKGFAQLRADRCGDRRRVLFGTDTGAWGMGDRFRHEWGIAAPIPPMDQVSNTEALGLVLYTRYVYFFEAAGLVLLVAMIGAIVLTLRHKPNVRRQNIADQVARTKATAISVRRVPTGQGIEGAPR